MKVICHVEHLQDADVDWPTDDEKERVGCNVFLHPCKEVEKKSATRENMRTREHNT